MYKLLSACLSTGSRSIISLAVLMLGGFFIFRIHDGMFWLLVAWIVVCVPVVLIMTWQTGGSEQKQHDASMNRLPGIDKRVQDWISDPDDYEFAPLPVMPQKSHSVVTETDSDSPDEAPQ